MLDVSTTTPKGIEFGGRFCSIGVFPIGIDPTLIRNTLKSRAVRRRTAELGATFKGRKVLIGVDRLDFIKGMPTNYWHLSCFWRGTRRGSGKLL